MSCLKEWVCFGIAGATLVYLVGCESYGFSGQHPSFAEASNLEPFRLEMFNIESGPTYGMAREWGVAYAGGVLDKEDFEPIFKARHPALLTSAKNACPIDVMVTVKTREVNHDLSDVCTFLSCFILPHKVRIDDFCQVNVKVGGRNGIDCPAGSVLTSSTRWWSLTPLGLLLPVSREVGYNGEFRSGRGPNVTPGTDLTCKQDQREVFCIEVSDAVAAALTRLDPNDLKRARVMHALNEGKK